MKRVLVIIVSLIILGTMPVGDTVAEEQISIEPPQYVRVINKSKKLVVKWNKIPNATYIVYKNGKKLKTLKSTKLSDKKVKLNKTYKYKVATCQTIGGKNVESKKSFQVSARLVNKKSKKVNASKFSKVKAVYSMGINGQITIKANAKASKKNKKKKLFDKKIRWLQTPNDLATISNKGVVTANNNLKTGKVVFYAIAHNGMKKKVTVNVTNQAYPSSYKNLYGVEEEIKPIITTYKKEIQDIVNYFEFIKGPMDISFDIDDEGNLKQSVETELDSKIKDELYNIVHNMPVTITVTKKYIRVERVDKTVYKTERVNAIVYGFARSTYSQCNNEYGGLIEIAPHWYTQFYEYYV